MQRCSTVFSGFERVAETIHTRRFYALFGCYVLLAVLAPTGVAHFRLLEPASWIQESEIGDPQWAPPCVD
jgi:hypothetical protein